MSSLHVTSDNFDVEILDSSEPVLLDFYADWCGPCQSVGPAVERLAETYRGRAKVAKVNIDQAADLASRFEVMSIPTFVFFKDGDEVGRVTGAVPEDALAERLGQLVR